MRAYESHSNSTLHTIFDLHEKIPKLMSSLVVGREKMRKNKVTEHIKKSNINEMTHIDSSETMRMYKTRKIERKEKWEKIYRSTYIDTKMIPKVKAANVIGLWYLWVRDLFVCFFFCVFALLLLLQSSCCLATYATLKPILTLEKKCEGKSINIINYCHGHFG